jgi:hypothetical protein
MTISYYYDNIAPLVINFYVFTDNAYVTVSRSAYVVVILRCFYGCDSYSDISLFMVRSMVRRRPCTRLVCKFLNQATRFEHSNVTLMLTKY